MKRQIISKKQGRRLWEYNEYINSWQNLHQLMRDSWIDDLYGKFPDVPGVVVSSGPSLDNQVAELHKLKDKALLFVCDRSVKFCLKHGIDPDFCITLDPQEFSVKYYQGLNLPKYMAIVYGLQVEPDIFTHWRHNRRFVLRAHNYLLKLFSNMLKKSKELNCWGTISSAAMAVLWEFGCSPVGLIGQDLCYQMSDAGEVISHCKGFWNEARKRRDRGEFIPVMNSDGKKVWTIAPFLAYKKHMETQIEQAPVTTFNLTPGGLKIKGTANVTCKDFLDICQPGKVQEARQYIKNVLAKKPKPVLTDMGLLRIAITIKTLCQKPLPTSKLEMEKDLIYQIYQPVYDVMLALDEDKTIMTKTLGAIKEKIKNMVMHNAEVREKLEKLSN